MIKDKTLRAVLFGKTATFEKPKTRALTMVIPGLDGEETRRIVYRADDGLFLHFIRRIEALEREVAKKNERSRSVKKLG